MSDWDEFHDLMGLLPPGERREGFPGQSSFDWIVDLFDNKAAVVNEKKADEIIPCICYHFPGRDVCFREGMWGPLNSDQRRQYCKIHWWERDTEVVDRATKIYQKHVQCKEKTKSIRDNMERYKVWMECMEEM